MNVVIFVRQYSLFMSGDILARLSVWSEMQMIYMVQLMPLPHHLLLQ